jgi:hypothetical protein
MAICVIYETSTKVVRRWGYGTTGCAGAPEADETEVSQSTGGVPVPAAGELLEWDTVGEKVQTRAETLAELKARLIVSVEAHHMILANQLEITHDSKQWCSTPHDHVEWTILDAESAGLTYPHDVFAKTEATTVADAAEIATILGLIADEIRAEDQACIDAKHNVNDAVDAAAAQTAHDNYVDA